LNELCTDLESQAADYELFGVVECKGAKRGLSDYEVSVKKSDRSKNTKVWIKFKSSEMNKIRKMTVLKEARPQILFYRQRNS